MKARIKSLNFIIPAILGLAFILAALIFSLIFYRIREQTNLAIKTTINQHSIQIEKSFTEALTQTSWQLHSIAASIATAQNNNADNILTLIRRMNLSPGMPNFIYPALLRWSNDDQSLIVDATLGARKSASLTPINYSAPFTLQLSQPQLDPTTKEVVINAQMRIEDSEGNKRGFLSLPLLKEAISHNIYSQLLDSALEFTLLQENSRQVIASSQSATEDQFIIEALSEEISFVENNQTTLYLNPNISTKNPSFIENIFFSEEQEIERKWSSNKIKAAQKIAISIENKNGKNMLEQKILSTPISIFRFSNSPYLLILRYDSKEIADKYHQTLLTSLSYFSGIAAIILLLALSYIFINQQILKPLRSLNNIADHILHNEPINRLPRHGFYELKHLAILLIRIHRKQKHRGESNKILAEQLTLIRNADAAYDSFTKNMRQALKQQFNSLINILSQLTLPKISNQHPALSINDELALLQEATQLVLSLRTQNTSKLEENWLEIETIANQSINLMQKYFLRSNATCKLSANKGIPNFWGDQLRIQQLILSALSRSLECLSSGNHVDLNISTEEIDNEKFLIISVNDNGFGLSEASRKQTYSLSDYPARYNSDGTYASRVVMERIVALHSGKLSIEDKESVGSSIKISMPFRQPPQPVISGKILPFPERK